MRFAQLLRPFSRLFRTTPPRTPPTPAAAVDRFAALNSGSPDFISGTALGSGDEALRAAAIHKLPDGDVLRSLAGLRATRTSPVSGNLERVARERLAQLIDAGTTNFGTLHAATQNQPALLSVAGLCSNPDHLAQALASLGNPQALARLVTDGSSSRLRQVAAQHIEDPAEIRQLLKQARNKDKSVYKILKQKSDALRAEEQRIAKISAEIDTVCAALERHSHRAFDPFYNTSLNLLEAEWLSVAAQAAPAIHARAHEAIDACREAIAEHLRRVAQLATEQAIKATREAAQRQADAEAQVEAQRQIQALADAPTEAANQQASVTTEVTAEAAAAVAARDAEQTALETARAADLVALQQIGAFIGRAQSALREGNTSRASALRRSLDDKLSAMSTVPPHLASRVQKLDASLNELKEWKDFAVAPKRAELIEEMTSLIGSTEEPEALAERIRQLQADWKTISKGIVSDTEADWQRFHLASQSAYQPCQVHFEAQAVLRQENLEQRRSVLERLQSFEAAQNLEQPDWRAIMAVLREAPLEWRQHFPVDRAAGRSLQESCDATLGRLQSKLDAWYAQNAAEKNSLIERARQLSVQEDGREAVEAIKRLQGSWKDIGPAERKLERQLWDQFREHCDAIFKKREQAYSEYTTELQANKAQAESLCEQIEPVTAMSGAALLEGASKIPEWRAAFEALGELPRSEERQLHERFERAIKTCQIHLAAARVHEKEQSFIHLFEAARLIRAYGWTLASDAPAADRDTLKEAAEAFIGSIQQWPKGGAHALKDAWTAAESNPDMAANELELRTLCIRSEIMSGLSTPAEDQTLRREYQVQRLLQHMGQRSDENTTDLDALTLEWTRIGPVAAATHEALFARFLRHRMNA